MANEEGSIDPQREALTAAHEARRAAEAAVARMALLADVGRVAVGALSVDDVTRGLVELLVPRVADLCSIEVVDHRGRARRAAVRWEGPGGEEVARRLLDDDDPALLDSLELAARVELALDSGGEAVGSLLLGVGPSGRRFGEEDHELFAIMAGRAALAIANARLVDELSSTRERLDRTLDTLAEAVIVIDPDRRIRYANQAAARLFGYGSSQDLIDAEQGAIAAHWIATLEDGRPLAAEDLPSWRVIRGLPAEPLLIHIVHRETGEERWRLVKATPLRSDKGRVLAVSVIEDVTETKEAELRERFLAQAGEALSSSLDVEETLQRVADLAVPALADWCGVDMVDARGTVHPVAVAHVDPAKVAFAKQLRERYPPRAEDQGGVQTVVRTGEPALYPKITAEMLEAGALDAEHLAGLHQLDMRAAMVVPMAVGGHAIGAITFVSAESGRSFDEDHLAFAGELARRAATAVENARLYTERTQTALTLQESLLPARLPALPGWRTATSYRPGDDTAQVGGDFYDVVALERGFLVVVGDVTGKGVEAAALTALARYTMATAARFDPSPAAVVRLLNDVLVERARPSLLTVVCAHLEPRRDAVAMRLACAGHPTPLLGRDGHDAVAVGRPGLLLGAVPDATWQESELELQPGDTVLFFTDGVIDTPGAQERFGDERLRAAVRDGTVEPEALLGRIDAVLRDFQDGEVVDDRAMLALQLVSLPAEREEDLSAAAGPPAASTP
jgi:serine phosphatase RsbU (regulator of sigma subunit)/PAS domain-containing protein